MEVNPFTHSFISNVKHKKTCNWTIFAIMDQQKSGKNKNIDFSLFFELLNRVA